MPFYLSNMLEPNFKDYEINTLNIWDFEYDFFFDPPVEFMNFSVDRVMEELYEKIQRMPLRKEDLLPLMIRISTETKIQEGITKVNLIVT